MTNLSTKGQIVIPEKVREELNWQPGERLTIETNQGQVVLRKLSQDFLSTKAVAKSSVTCQKDINDRDENEILHAVSQELKKKYLGIVGMAASKKSNISEQHDYYIVEALNRGHNG